MRSSTSDSASAKGAATRSVRPRRSQVDLGLAGGCAVTVALVFLVWTGVIPSSLYPASPAQWTMEVPTCSHAGEAEPVVNHGFPLWSTVDVRWTATGGNVWYLVQGRGLTLVSQIGKSGNGSFFSNAESWAFSAVDSLPPNGTGCQPIVVVTTVTYTL